MTPTVQCLFPVPQAEVPVRGLYLDHGLHRLGTATDPFVYGNFLTTLDGRIALGDGDGRTATPAAMRSDNDLRLLLELQAQADCLVTHGGYLRDLAAGRLDNILQVGITAGAEDLADWRARQRLPPQPDIVIASASLDFPLPDRLRRSDQRVMIATGAGADQRAVARWREAGLEVLSAGVGTEVEGGPLVEALGRRGYRQLYLLAGPLMLATMVAQGRLRRLYLTVTHQLVGGDHFATLFRGPPLTGACSLQLRSLYLDSQQPEGASQWFAQFESKPGAAPELDRG